MQWYRKRRLAIMDNLPFRESRPMKKVNVTESLGKGGVQLKKSMTTVGKSIGGFFGGLKKKYNKPKYIPETVEGDADAEEEEVKKEEPEPAKEEKKKAKRSFTSFFNKKKSDQ